MSGHYAVLIAEDDALYRASIVHAVPWGDVDCVLIGAVSSGEDALEVLRRRRIDLLITDVEMPGINGIELMARARELRPGLQCLMLSNFDTFDYVKSSLTQGADDYLLKQSLAPASLRAAVERVVASRPRTEADEAPQPEDAGWGLMLRRDITRALLTGELDASRRGAAGQVLFQGGEPRRVVAACFAMSRYLEHLSRVPRDAPPGHFVSMLLDLCEEALGPGAVVCVVDENLYGALIPMPIDNLHPTVDGELVRMHERLVGACGKLLNAEIMAEVSRPVAGADGLAAAWEQLRRQLESRQFETPPQPREHGGQQIALLDLTQERDLFAAIVAGDEAEVSHMVSGLFPAASERGPSRNALLMLANDLLNLGIRVCKNRGLHPECFLDGPELPQASIARAASLDELTGYVRDRLASLARRFAGAAPGSPLAQRALAIIHTRFDEPLTLAGVAHEVGVSASHLSRVLTSGGGAAFGEELTRTRLEAAKQLLSDQSLSIHQISRRCGYANYTYFFNVFRKRFGMTPQTYRNQVAGP